MSTRAFRYDAGQMKKATITPQGYLKADAYATRAGIFIYRKADGSIQKELRPAEEVFNSDSLNSLAEVPITNDHPQNPLTIENTKMLAVGYTGSNVGKVENDYVKCGVTIYDQGVIDGIMNGQKNQLSGGYTCDIEMTPGIHNGMSYDAIQKNIRYNHLAIVREGRAGPYASIKLDSADAVMIDEEKEDAEWSSAKVNDLPDSSFAYVEPGDKDEDGKTTPRSKRHFPYKNANGEIDLPHLRNALARLSQSPFGDKAKSKLIAAAKKAGVGDYEKKDGAEDKNNVTSNPESKKGEFIMSMVKVKIDSKEYEVPEEIAAEMQRKDSEMAKTQGKLDATEAMLKADKAKNSAKDEDGDEDECDDGQMNDKKKDKGAKKMDRQDAIALGREFVEVENLAFKVIGKEFKSDGLDIIDMKKSVIKAALPDIKLDGKSDDYVNATFDHFKSNYKSPEAKKLQSGLGNVRSDDGVSAAQARADAMDRMRNRWKKPLVNYGKSEYQQ